MHAPNKGETKRLTRDLLQLGKLDSHDLTNAAAD
jgi:hypothetical protein